MPSPYSYDLRIRVVAAVEKGMGVKEATGDVQAKVGYQQGHSPKITDPEQFTAFVRAQGDATLDQLAEAWGGVKRMTIWRQLRKIGYTHKKRPFAMPRETRS